MLRESTSHRTTLYTKNVKTSKGFENKTIFYMKSNEQKIDKTISDDQQMFFDKKIIPIIIRGALTNDLK